MTNYKFQAIFKAYSYIFKKLLSDSLYRFKKRTIILLGAGILGTFCQVGAIGQILFYAKALENNKSLQFLSYTFEPRSFELFLLFICVFFVLLIFATLLIYYSKSQIIQLAAAYEAFCVQRIYLLLAKINGIVVPGYLTRYDKKQVQKLSTSDARFIGMVTRLLFNLVQPILTLLFALGITFYLNWWLTLLVLMGMFISFFFHYQNNLKGTTYHSNMEKTAEDAASKKRELYELAIRKKTDTDNFKSLISSTFSSGPIPENLEYYKGRFQAIEDANLINNLAMTILVVMVISILGGKAFATQGSWGNIVAYIVALRYCLAQFRISLTTWTSINRFYTLFSRYLYFIEYFSNKERNPSQTQRVQRKYIISSSTPDSETIKLYPSKGTILALVVPISFEPSHLPLYLSVLFHNNSGLVDYILKSSRVIKANDAYLSGLSFRDLFDFSDSVTYNQLISFASSVGLSHDDMSWPENIDQPCPKYVWEAMSWEAKYILAFLSAKLTEAQWIIVDEKVLQYLSENLRSKVFKQLEGRYIVLVYKEINNTIGMYREESVAIVDDENIIGLGSLDWYWNNKAKISETLERKNFYKYNDERTKTDEENEMYNDMDIDL